MTDQDAATGQFISAEPLYGLAGIEHDAGYVPMPDPDEKKKGEEIGSDDVSLRAYAEEVFGPGENQVVVRELLDGDGNPAPENETLTIEQAGKLLTEAREAERSQDEAAANKSLAD